jgi:hypothetical protein
MANSSLLDVAPSSNGTKKNNSNGTVLSNNDRYRFLDASGECRFILVTGRAFPSGTPKALTEEDIIDALEGTAFGVDGFILNTTEGDGIKLDVEGTTWVFINLPEKNTSMDESDIPEVMESIQDGFTLELVKSAEAKKQEVRNKKDLIKKAKAKFMKKNKK